MYRQRPFEFFRLPFCKINCIKLKNLMKTKSLISLLMLLLAASGIQAADDAKTLVTVNGEKLGQNLLNQMVANSTSQGTKDTPELRAALENELIVREVLAQEARKQRLDQDAQVAAQMRLLQSALLAETLINRQSEKFSTGEEKLRAEYKRQADLLADAEEYQLSQVVTATEAEAKAVIKSTKDGESFEKLAREKSISPSRQNGGGLGWILANQITPTIGNVVANMTTGAVTSMPIATPEGWQIIRLDGKRKYKVPSYEDSKQQLINAVLANERAEFIQKLVKAATIKK